MTIQYFKKNVYGNELIYIKDDTIADIITGLTGKKTITEWDIERLEKLGHVLIQVMN